MAGVGPCVPSDLKCFAPEKAARWEHTESFLCQLHGWGLSPSGDQGITSSGAAASPVRGQRGLPNSRETPQKI